MDILTTICRQATTNPNIRNMCHIFFPALLNGIFTPQLISMLNLLQDTFFSLLCMNLFLCHDIALFCLILISINKKWELGGRAFSFVISFHY